MAKHWMQTPEGRERMRKIMKDRWSRGVFKNAHKKKSAKRLQFKQLARSAYHMSVERATQKALKQRNITSLVIGGWRISLQNDEIKIERE